MSLYGIDTKLVGLLLQPRDKTEVNVVPVGGGLNSVEGNWNNPPAGSDEYLPLTVDASTIKVDDHLSIGEMTNATGDSSVFASEDRMFVSNKAVMPSVTMDIMPQSIGMSAIILLALQFAAQGVTPGFAKTCEPRNELIDMLNDDGILATIQGVDSAGYGFLLENAVIDTMTLVINNDIGDVIQNIYKLSVKFVGRKITRGVTTSGTFDALTGDDLTFYGSPEDTKTVVDTLNFNSGDLIVTLPCWKQYTLNIVNNFTPYCLAADSYLLGFTRNAPEITSELIIPYNDSTKTILNRVAAGENYLYTISKTGLVIGDPNYFKITSNYNLGTEDPEDVENNQMSIKLTGKVLKGSSTWFQMINTDSLDYLSKAFDTAITN